MLQSPQTSPARELGAGAWSARLKVARLAWQAAGSPNAAAIWATSKVGAGATGAVAALATAADNNGAIRTSRADRSFMSLSLVDR
jgi:hypothetical protein